MKSYSYIALTTDGHQVTGHALADSELFLDRDLESRGLTLTQAKVSAVHGKAEGARLKPDQLIRFTTQLATMTGAGIPLIESLQGIGERIQDDQARVILDQMAAGLQAGESLSECMGHYPRAFPDVYRSSVEAGEASGDLEGVLERLASYMEWVRGMRATTVQALIYPAVLLVAIAGLITILLAFVLPRITGLFPTGTELPRVTEIVIGISDFLRAQALWLFLGALGGVVAWRVLARRRAFQLRFHTVLLKLPIVGSLMARIATSKFAGTASTLQAAGVDVFTTLRVSSAASGNAAMEAGFERVSERVRLGEKLSDALSVEPLTDPLLIQMIGVGERSGRLDGCLARLSSYYDEEVPRAVKRFLSLLEPGLLVFAGVVVTIILLAALLPIFQLYETLG